MAIHRQKYKWRRQAGCQLIPLPCNPCGLEANLYPINCPAQTVECPIYPWESSPTVQSFGTVLTSTLTSAGVNVATCDLNSLNTKWYVDIRLDDVVVVQSEFFSGYGYNISGVSYPSDSTWYNAVTVALNTLVDLGYDYYFTENNTVVIYNSICSTAETGVNFKLNVGINFNILCNQ